jgi:CheY-like chemotaxis protein
MRNKTILLADDDLLLINILTEILTEVGFSVELAINAKETLEKLRDLGQIDLMILDIMLPLEGAFDDGVGGLNAGIKILSLIKQSPAFMKWQNLPVVCYTALGINDKIRKGLENLGARIVAKSENPNNLINTIEEMIQ